MNLDPREANCLEILARESEKYSLDDAYTPDPTELNQWCSALNTLSLANFKPQPVPINCSKPVPTSIQKEKRFTSSEPLSRDFATFRTKKNSSKSRLSTASPRQVISVVVTNPNIIPKPVSTNSKLTYPTYSSETMQNFKRRASTAIKCYRVSDLSKEDSFLRTTPTPPPCRCNINTNKPSDHLFCSHPECINKLISRYYKEYNVARHSQHIDRNSCFNSKSRTHTSSKSALEHELAETPTRSIGLKRYHKHIHNESWEQGPNKLYSSLITKLDDASFRLPDFSKIHNSRSLQRESRLDKKKVVSGRLYSCI
jgi:hypothetical protein